MLEPTAVAQDIDKAGFKQAEPELRTQLLEAQFDLLERKRFPLILLFAGLEGAGVVDALTGANKVLDTRHVVTFAHRPPTEEEAERPRLWRYWRVLPPKGEIGIYAGGWYAKPLTDRILKKIGRKAFERELERIKKFEEMLTAEGAMILKFWLHLGKKDQQRRLEEMAGDQRTSWRVEESPWGGSRNYRRVKDTAERMMQATGSEAAPWIPVDATNQYFRNLSIATTVLSAIRSRLDSTEPETKSAASVPADAPDADLLNRLDLSLALDKQDYKKQLERYQDRLNKLVWSKKFNKRSLVLVFEGNDAAGKGGAIRRVTEFLDPRLYRVNQFAAPTDEEKAQPYLWRFWRRLPRYRHIAIFDRSWYGRVLVERVEGFCPAADWQRAYDEINEFEAEMADAGSIVVKFWLAIDKEQQAARFKAREETGYKRHKITEEDWRNREKWDQYASAVRDMVSKTDTSHAPWVLVEANDKRYARVKVLKSICNQLEKALREA